MEKAHSFFDVVFFGSTPPHPPILPVRKEGEKKLVLKLENNNRCADV
jgi:hypothetical protein